MEKKYKNIRIYNIVMGFLHFVQGVLMVVLSADFALPVTSSFLQFSREMQKLVPVVNEEFTLQLGPVIASFLFMSSLAHFVISMPVVYEWYVNNLKKQMNIARWIEYSFSSSVMMVAISMLAGIYDGVSLMMIFFLNAAMILFGWVMELHNQSTRKTDWTSYWFGSLVGIIPWIAVGIYLFGAGSENAEPPTFVYWIFFSIFVFFNLFAINMVLQYKKIGKWSDYLYGEKAYILLSLIAKSLLAWQVWAGTLRPV